MKINNSLNIKLITGFTDGEGCFYVTFHKSSKLATGW